MAKLKKLEQAEKNALRACEELHKACNAEASEKTAVFREALAAELEAKYGAEIQAAGERYDAAKQAANEERERIAREAKHAYPLGTVLYQWKDMAATWSRNSAWKLTGKRGVCEVITRESEHPSSWRQRQAYRRADIGAFVCRHLKKNGTPTAKYETTGWSDQQHPFYRWYPEGVTPEQAEQENAATRKTLVV